MRSPLSILHPIRIRLASDFDTREMTFPKTGSYLVFCGIHPRMELNLDVAR
jgi:plastocyanin